MSQETATLDIIRKHVGKTGYRWYLEVGMDVIEALHVAFEMKNPGDIEDFSDAIIDILLDCHPALGTSLLHILLRNHLIKIDDIIRQDDVRRDRLLGKYKGIIRVVVESR